MKKTLSQLTCWYQFDRVMGESVMCGFFGSYFAFLLGSSLLAIGEGWEERNSGLTASMPAEGW